MKHNVLVAVPTDLSLDAQRLVMRFASEMAEKLHAAELKGRGGWEKPGWQVECTEQLYVHLAKGDPVDVANVCAFMWHHKWSTGTPAVMTQDLGENDKLLLLTSKHLTPEQNHQVRAYFDKALASDCKCLVASGFDKAVVIRKPHIQVREKPEPVAWRAPDGFGDYIFSHERVSADWEPLFAAPVKETTGAAA